MTIDEFIQFFGTQVAAAKAIGATQPSISMWRKRGRIPHLQQIRIEVVTKGKLKAEPLFPAKDKAKRITGVK